MDQQTLMSNMRSPDQMNAVRNNILSSVLQSDLNQMGLKSNNGVDNYNQGYVENAN